MTHLAWLKANLGKSCTAPLTSTDALALAAAEHVAELWCYSPSKALALAFGAVVQMMQPKTRHLAFHVVAKVGNWEDRARLWSACELPWPEPLWKAVNEPGGST